MEDQIERLIIDVVGELTQDWDLDDLSITEDTELCADAGFESLDIVQLVVLIEKKLGGPGIPFEQLFMQHGRYIDDVTIKELAAFIVSKTNS
jgi:acyl carrier protein